MKQRKKLTFRGANEDDDSLPRGVIEGRETVTSEGLEDYYQSYGEYRDGGNEEGDIIEVYDLRKNLCCIIKVILNPGTITNFKVAESLKL